MNGETNIPLILKNLNPVLNKGSYVYCLIEKLNTVQLDEPIGIFREAKGFTLILETSVADNYGFSYETIYSWITLDIHTSLNAVGLTSVISAELAEQSITCNMVAAYYHDHIFVKQNEADAAMHALNALTRR